MATNSVANIFPKFKRVRPIEIKSSRTFNASLVRNLREYVGKDAAAESPMLIYDGEPIPSFGDELIAASNFRDAQF